MRATGFLRYLAWKDQTAWGSKASSLSKTMVPLRSGPLFDADSYRRARATVASAIVSAANYYNVSKFASWNATLELINPRLANDTIRAFFRSAFGLETVLAGPPLTKTYQLSDPIVDGGVDNTPVNTVYGRGLTLHEQCNRSDGTLIFGHEVQDATVDSLDVIWEPDAVVLLRAGGRASDLQPNMASVTYAGPAGSVHTHDHVDNTANSGLRIGTANPPVQANDNVVFSRATFSLKNKMAYENYLGMVPTMFARIPVRGDTVDMMLEVVMDVEDDVASTWDSKNAIDQWAAGTNVNVDLLSYINANEIAEFKATGAAGAAIVDKVVFATPNAGALQATATIKIAPAAQTDPFFKFTTVD